MAAYTHTSLDVLSPAKAGAVPGGFCLTYGSVWVRASTALRVSGGLRLQRIPGSLRREPYTDFCVRILGKG